MISSYAFTVRNYIEQKSLLTSVQRVIEYINLPEEDRVVKPNDSEMAKAGWPRNGHITFDKVFMKYRPDLPPALNNLDFEVKTGMKIGIVGRTGAGKSSIL